MNVFLAEIKVLHTDLFPQDTVADSNTGIAFYYIAQCGKTKLNTHTHTHTCSFSDTEFV